LAEFELTNRCACVDDDGVRPTEQQAVNKASLSVSQNRQTAVNRLYYQESGLLWWLQEAGVCTRSAGKLSWQEFCASSLTHCIFRTNATFFQKAYFNIFYQL